MLLINTRARFGAIAKMFHWTMAIAFVAAYPIVYYVIWFIDPETSVKPALFGIKPDGGLVVPLLNIHWILGVLVGVLVVPRWLWRVWNPEPDPVPGLQIEHLMARFAHWCLYLLMVVMPLTGYLNTYDPTNFGIFVIPAFRDTSLFHWVSGEFGLSWKEVETPMYAIHRFVGHWIAWLVVVLHVAAALFHHMVRRDDTLIRMLPGNGSRMRSRPKNKTAVALNDGVDC